MKNNLVLLQNLQLHGIPEEESDSELFITQYDPRYCKLLLDYAYTNMDIDGFYAKYMILPETSEKWEQDYPEWKRSIKMAPYKVKDSLNTSMKVLSDIASGTKRVDPVTVNIDLLQRIIFRAIDVNFKMEKDTGDLKRKGQERARAAKSKPASQQLNDQVSAIVEGLMNSGTITAQPNFEGEDDDLLPPN